jgi:hypothetical protein
MRIETARVLAREIQAVIGVGLTADQEDALVSWMTARIA